MSTHQLDPSSQNGPGSHNGAFDMSQLQAELEAHNPTFLSIPREIRDAIYLQVLTSPDPLPTSIEAAARRFRLRCCRFGEGH